MKQYWINGLKNFAVGTMLAVVFWGLLGFIVNILLGFMYVWNILWLYRFIIFVFYWAVLNWWIYGTPKKERRYLDSLPRDHRISMKEDYLRFLKQEGLPIMVYYTICMTLQVFVFQFHKGYFQTFFIILAPLGIELSPVANWILSFMFFVIGYQVISIVRRRNIRKEKYDFLFERHVAENQ